MGEYVVKYLFGLAQVAQRSCRCPISGSVQVQGIGQPGLMGIVPAHCKKV